MFSISNRTEYSGLSESNLVREDYSRFWVWIRKVSNSGWRSLAVAPLGDAIGVRGGRSVFVGIGTRERGQPLLLALDTIRIYIYIFCRGGARAYAACG